MKSVGAHIILVLFLPLFSFSQITFPETDRETYRFYTEQKWDSLHAEMEEGRKSIIYVAQLFH